MSNSFQKAGTRRRQPLQLEQLPQQVHHSAMACSYHATIHFSLASSVSIRFLRLTLSLRASLCQDAQDSTQPLHAGSPPCRRRADQIVALSKRMGSLAMQPLL